MANYKLIADIETLQTFVNTLPENGKTDIYYVGVFARTKYAKQLGIQIPAAKAQLAVAFTKRETIVDTVKTFEIAQGLYKINGVEIPNEILSVYIYPNARCYKKASYLIKQKIDENTYVNNVIQNPIEIANTALKKSVFAKVYQDFDFDDVSDEEIEILKTQISEILNPEAYQTIKTNSGFHLLINLSKIDKSLQKSYYRKLQILPKIDMSCGSDKMLPLLGCYHANKIVKFC